MPVNVALTIGAVLAICATVLGCIFIIPQKRVPQMNKFLYTLHTIANFKSLLLEKILKVLYMLLTCFCILGGFFMLFSTSYDYWYGGSNWNGGYGLLLMLLGPILVRLVFESMMMFIILVNHVGELRRHFCDDSQDPNTPMEAKVKPNWIFCGKCGTRYDANAGGCPNGCANIVPPTGSQPPVDPQPPVNP